MVEPNNGWQEQANCKSIKDDTFFNDNKKDKRFKKICDACPVLGECLEYALVYSMQGTWGGMTEKERSRLSKRNIAALRDDRIESGYYNPKLKV